MQNLYRIINRDKKRKNRFILRFKPERVIIDTTHQRSTIDTHILNLDLAKAHSIAEISKCKLGLNAYALRHARDNHSFKLFRCVSRIFPPLVFRARTPGAELKRPLSPASFSEYLKSCKFLIAPAEAKKKLRREFEDAIMKLLAKRDDNVRLAGWRKWVVDPPNIYIRIY